MSDLVRAFICVDFPSEVIKEVARIQELLENQKFTGKLTELENLHVTLKFLGEVAPEKLEKVKEELSKINFPKLRLRLANTGLFSKKGNPRIAWVRINGDILELQKHVDDALAHLFPKEARFMSHLAIARIKHVSDKEAFKDYVKNMGVKQLSFPINSFKLMSSELKSMGPTYKIIKEYKLN